MNKKRRRLTLAALAAFGLIILFHYCDPWFHGQLEFGTGGAWHGGRYIAGSIEPLIAEVQMPLFVLAVVYFGLFFLFGGKDAEPVPRRSRNWRGIRIIGLILAGLLVIVGLIGTIIDFQEKQRRTQEQERRSEQSRRDAIEVEDSKHRITASEIDLIDLRFERPGLLGTAHLTGRIRNRAAHNRTLNSITLIVTLREKEGSPDVLGNEKVQIRVEVPPHQTRAISQTVYFPDVPQLTHPPAWTYGVLEIRGSKGHDWQDDPIVKDFDPDKYLGLTPTPSPKP